MSEADSSTPIRRSGPSPALIVLGILATVFLLFLMGAFDFSEARVIQYDRDQAWNRLGLGDQEDFDRKLEQLARVKIDALPEVGTEYNPTFPDPIPFNPSQWITNSPSPSIGMPEAKPGGMLRQATSSWPPTVRTDGPNSRLGFLSQIHSNIYETLLDYDTRQNDYVPSLASHWQIDPDKQTFRFRIDSRARWADGREVTAHDVVSTFQDHLLNPDREDPTGTKYWEERIAEVKMLDKYTVEFKSKEKRWRAFYVISGQQIFPAAYIAMDGETYIHEWNWKLPPGSGPYELRPEGIKDSRSITIHRRQNYWRQDDPSLTGMYNFDSVRWTVIRDRELEYQKFLAGELDLYVVGKAQRWVDELDQVDAIRKGWIQKRKIYTLNPNGYGGYCFNMRVAPFDSLNVRKAFAHLFNREKLFAKLFFYQYQYTDSYFPGQEWARPDRKRVNFDPDKARKLLAEDGWSQRDSAGYLTRADGTRFPTIKILMPSPSWARIHGVIQEDLWKEAGIKLETQQILYSAFLKKVWEQKFQLVYFSWTAGLFPDMKMQFFSEFADQMQSNNLNGFKDKRADEIMIAYQTEFDAKKRKAMIHELDQILFDAHPYALGWYAPYFRVIYWDKFGYPPEYVSRYGDSSNVIAYWWFDEKRQKKMANDRTAGRSRTPSQSDIVDQFWWLENPDPRPRTKGASR